MADNRGARRNRRFRLMARKIIANNPHCWLCNEPIDLTITDQYDPRYGTIDHVIPFSKGGNDSPSNLRPSHRGCNISRQDRDPAALGVNPTSRKW